MKVYIVIDEYANDGDGSVTIIGVFKNKSQAIEKLKSHKEALLNQGIKYSVVLEDSDLRFEVCEEGEYWLNHTNLYIEEKEVE